MVRKIIKIDSEKCSGCGACAAACHEGAIEMIDGKAVLTRENYCDGLGDCLPACPVDAISFELREAPAYDEAAVLRTKQEKERTAQGCSCSGAQTKSPSRAQGSPAADAGAQPSCLPNWPVQLKLVPSGAPYFNGADLLIAADCSAYAYGSFHEDFIRGRVTVIGCPKLDGVDYTDKLAAILAGNDVRSVTLVRMEVPCCGGLAFAARSAIEESGRDIPLRVVTITADGQIV